MHPRTPSPLKRGFGAAAAAAGAGDDVGLPPPPLFQVPEGQSNFYETLKNNDLRLHRKSPSKGLLSRSSTSKGWNDDVESWEERDVSSPTKTPFSPSMFYSPTPSEVTATTAPMTTTPTEVDLLEDDINSNYMPFTTLSPTAVPYCHPLSPPPPPPPPAYSSSSTRVNRNNNSRYESKTSTPISHKHAPSHFHGTKNNTTSHPPGYSTPRRSPTKRRTPNSASSTGSNPGDDPNRKQRLKTELCMHYRKGKKCPFGERCTYAHGEEELQLTKLMDMQRAGLIEDFESYRTKPCWTFVATGSCPFGIRCGSIHDPRTTGEVASWLPHTETQGNSMSTDINVDGLHQKRLHVVHHGNPFGDQFSLEDDDFTDLYKLVCNSSRTSRKSHHRCNLSEIHKLSIALQMRGDAGWMYKYRPQHIVHGSFCMVLQKQAFMLEKSGKAIPIPFSKYNGTPRHVLVRELAFGPDSDPSVRGVALYFNIAKGDITECTAQQAKRFRWKKAPRGEDKKTGKISIFDTRESFVMIRPFEADAFDLVGRILQHRFDTIKAEQLTALAQRFKVMKQLAREKEVIRGTFQAHKKDWINWSWPICLGREHVDEDTHVRPVEAEYIPIVDPSLDQDPGDAAIKGSVVRPIWESFVAQAKNFNSQVEDFDHMVKKNLFASVDALAPRTDGKRRLAIFTRLASGYQVSQNRSLPHIKNTTTNAVENDMLDRQSGRCWRALLLEQVDKEFAKRGNEWKVVQDHFTNARSNKTLKIIQD